MSGCSLWTRCLLWVWAGVRVEKPRGTGYVQRGEQVWWEAMRRLGGHVGGWGKHGEARPGEAEQMRVDIRDEGSTRVRGCGLAI